MTLRFTHGFTRGQLLLAPRAQICTGWLSPLSDGEVVHFLQESAEVSAGASSERVRMEIAKGLNVAPPSVS